MNAQSILTFIYFYLVLTTVATNTNVTSASTHQSPFVTLCNKTVAVYYNGMPIYTIVAKEGCIKIFKISDNYTIINNTIMFWEAENVTLLSSGEYESPKLSFSVDALKLLALVYAVLRKLSSLKSEE